jgi:hypothetical protein
MRTRNIRALLVAFILGYFTCIPFKTAFPQQLATANDIRKAIVGSFTIDIPKGWTAYGTAEASILRREYLEQSKQIYQAFTGSDDPSKEIDIAAFHISRQEGTFAIVSFSIPPQTNLIQTLKDQVGDKMQFGIQQGFIRRYLGLVSIDRPPLTGFYTKAIGKSGNIEASAGLQHSGKANTIIQLTLLAPAEWDESKANYTLDSVLKSVVLTQKQ